MESTQDAVIVTHVSSTTSCMHADPLTEQLRPSHAIGRNTSGPAQNFPKGHSNDAEVYPKSGANAVCK